MKIKFCGAAREVTGSAHLVTLEDGYTILLDCGLYQGNDKEMKDFNESFFFDPSQVDCLVLSHAHIDHTGRVPKLVKEGFAGPIYATHATRSLCSIMLLDSAMIQERDAEYQNKRNPKVKAKPLYESKHVHMAMQQYVSCPYDRWIPIHEDVDLQYRDAGHILGSASVTLRIRQAQRTIHLGFTGDIGRYDRPILRDPRKMPAVDYLICESTYGDRLHEEKPAEIERFLRILTEACVERKGKLLIPAFSVGRTQEIVYMLDRLENDGRLPHIPVFVDSPLAVNATSIFGAHPECYDEELEHYLLTDDDPFGFNGLQYIKRVEASKALNGMKGPCIIISAAGMMNAGRSKHHLANMIENPKHTILIVGYASPETPAGKLREGAKGLRLFGEYKVCRARVEIMDSFSAHADRNEIAEFLNGQQQHCKNIFLVHGTIERQEHLAHFLQSKGFREVSIPELGEEVRL
ncbi:MAG: MBL fold metallo-hydrolase [Bacteroidetes bacterium]|nr:MAG: MBL fold metallo-hydrolase [Bacteroidota bacterium]